MWINYSDSEVKIFHPICEKALNGALIDLNMNKEYEVVHHLHTGSLEMDFCIRNIATGKVFCVIEVKRTPNDVHSTRYQYQAMSYVQMNEKNNESSFYILTNLEYMYSFKYDKNRPRVFQQMLSPGIIKVAMFSDEDKESFTLKLRNTFKDLLNSFVCNNYSFSVTLEQFADHMEALKLEPKKWKSHLAILLYEYIRGALSTVNRNELKDIRLFKNNIKIICNEALKINFKDIFTLDDNEFDNSVFLDTNVLNNMFKLGEQYANGDAIASILHDIVSQDNRHNGEVPTDIELSRFVCCLAKYCIDDRRNIKVCDPAAGSGNLMSSAIEVFKLNPTQIKVNDINSLLLELLSLRLGLNYPYVISPSNSVTISNYDIADLSAEYFSDVDCVVLNPPYIAGINCVDKKKKLYNAIKKYKKQIKTKIGQMPYEGPFIELLLELCRKGTVIVCVLSKTHLVGRGPESETIRNLLLNEFGLKTIFTYPGNDIFNDVTKDTCVLVGIVGQDSELVNVISSYENIPNLDLHTFEISLKNEYTSKFTQIMSGVEALTIKKSELIDNISNGWRIVNSEISNAVEFVEKIFSCNDKFTYIHNTSIKLKRGLCGNNGASDLIFYDDNSNFYDIVKAIPNSSYGLRNAKEDCFYLKTGDSRFLDSNILSKSIISKIIDIYLKTPLKMKRQIKTYKNKDDLISIINKESKNIVNKESILIPRNIRRNGRVYFNKNDLFVSTNFVIGDSGNSALNYIYATWMTTIFYQLICECSSKDEAGTRKMEIPDLMTTYVPVVENISNDKLKLLFDEVLNIEFLDLQNPEIRTIDRIWAGILFDKDADKLLSLSKDYLMYVSNRRNT